MKRFDNHDKIVHFEDALNSLDILRDASSMPLVYEEVEQKASFPTVRSPRLLQFEGVFLWIGFYSCN